MKPNQAQAWITAAALVAALAACQQATSARGSSGLASESGTQAPARITTEPPVVRDVSRDSAMNELASYLPVGTEILDIQRGDLTGQGGMDVLLVIEPSASSNQKLGEGVSRSVVLLTRDAAGSLRKVAENSRIVPCKRCGGMAGDPFGYARIDKGGFTLAISGGSRERWSDEFGFRFDPAQNAWLLEKVVREVIDNEADHYERLDLSTKDFGKVLFGDFDPATLPMAVLNGAEQVK